MKKTVAHSIVAGIFLSCLNLGAQEPSNTQTPYWQQDYHPVIQKPQKTRILSLTVPASSLTSVGIDQILPFIQEAPGGQVTFIVNGDSMAEQGRSMPYNLVRLLEERLGAVAYVGNYRNTMMQTSTNGTAFDPPNWKWYSGTLPLPPGKEYIFEKEQSAGGVLADGTGMLWTAHTNGGQFKLLVSTNGGPFGEIATLDGYSSNPTGEGRNFLFDQLPITKYRLKAIGISGTNSLVAPRIGQYHTNGIEVCFFAWGGIAISDIIKVPAAIRSAILSAFAGRTVIILTLVHDDPYYLPQMNGLLYGIPELESTYDAVLPQHLSINIGATYASADTNSNQTADQNEIIRNVTITSGDVYLDTMNPSVSYEYMLTNGWLLDFVHLSNIGGSNSARIAWNDMGLYALNVPRTLTIEHNNGFATLTHGRSMNASYMIQSSTNSVDWLDLGVSPAGSTPYSTNVVTSGESGLFRLKLSPP